MACAPCEARKKQREEQVRNLQVAPRPSVQPVVKSETSKPASPKFQSPTILPPLKK